MSGLIGKKIGMTSIFDDNGRIRPCTVIEAGPCTITQIKDRKNDGYNAIQLSYDDLSKKRLISLHLVILKNQVPNQRRK